GLWIIDRNLYIHMSEVTPLESFGDAHGFTVRVPRIVEPGTIVETNRFQDERIALPFADRVAEPCLLFDFRKPASIGKYLSKVIHFFKKDHNHAWCLND